VQCAAPFGSWDGIDWSTREVSYGTTLTGLYPDSPMPSIAVQRYSPAFYKLVTFIAFLNQMSENWDN